jgi:hypothetical protein
MRKLFYFLRVFFISFEFLLLLAGSVFYFNMENLIDNFVLLLPFNSEFAKWLILVPPSLFVWIFMEVKSLLAGDKETIRALAGWCDYWMLKTHTSINLIYSFIFLFFSIAPASVDEWFKNIRFVVVFVIGFLGLLISARDIYFANIRVKELVGRLKNP